jgi:beta-lactamase regulating signal transducer with metallopeptidase domain
MAPEITPASVARTETAQPIPAATIASNRSKRKPAAFPIAVPPSRWPRWLIVPWLSLSLLLLARLMASLLMLNRLKARARQAPACLASRVEDWLAQCEGTRSGIRLALSAEIPTPIAAGPLNPAILIPERLFGELTADDLDRIGLHETAHLVRRDDYALIIQRALEAIFVVYPLVYWIARRIDLEREIACDDLVIAATGRPRLYAACLARIVEAADGMGSPWPVATAAEDRSQLARRVDALLDKTRHMGAHLMKRRLGAVTAMLIALVFTAGRVPSMIAFVVTGSAPFRASHMAAWRAPAVVPLVAQSQAEATPEQGVLSGQVTEDHSGNPIASAELRFHKTGLRELSADLETDRNGRFSGAGLPNGEYSVDVSKPNYISTTFRLTVPGPNPNVRLLRYGVIDGQATDASGRTLPGVIRAPGGRSIGFARVTVLTKDTVSGELKKFRDIVLEEGGHYRAYDLPPGQYTLGFWYSGQNEGSGMQLYPDNLNPRIFSVSGGEEYSGINFVTARHAASQIRGTVQVPAGVQGQFQLALGLPDQPLIPLAQTLSENDGTFRFEQVPAGNYNLFVSGPVGGYGAFDSTLKKGDVFFGRTLVPVSGQNIENLSVPVSAGRSLGVVLKTRDSAALPAGCPASAPLTLAPLEPWAILYFPGGQASFGKEHAVPNLPPGKFRVTATELGSSCFQANDAIADMSGDSGSSGPVAIELVAAGSVRGVLHGAPAGAFAVLMEAHAVEGAQARIAYADSNGAFVFEGLAPARYRVAAFPAGAAPRARWATGSGRAREVEVRGGQATSVELTTGGMQ